MPIDESLRDDILKQTKIENVIASFLEITKKGKNFFAVCPFHDDTNPSMVISPEKQIFRCFVCGTSGNAISFVMKYLKISYREALKKVAEISGIHDPRLENITKSKPVDKKKEPLLKCLKDLTTYYQFALNTEEGQEGLKYFENRDLDATIRDKYKLGYALKDGRATIKFLQAKGHSLKTIEDIGIATIRDGEGSDRNQGRVVFPICDENGDVVGFSARRIVDNGQSKYVNSPETYVFNKRKILYNYHIAHEKARTAGYIYVTEGFMDVFALGRIGIDAAVATMGTALTDEHIELLRKLNVEVRLCLDGDLPGQSAMMEISKSLLKANIPFRVVDNQGSSKDPDEILRDEGPESLKTYLNKLISRIDFYLNYFGNTNPLKTIEQKKQLIKQFIPILLGLKSSLEIDSYIARLARITGFEKESIKGLLIAARRDQKEGKNITRSLSTFHPERKVLRKLETAEREMLYQMLHHKEAVDFYEQKTSGFYDDVYRQIADFIVDYMRTHETISPEETVNTIEESEIENREELVNSITELCLENTHPEVLEDKFLEGLLETMNDERTKLFEKDMLDSSLEGKDPLEKARILAEYNKRKHKK